MLCRAICHPSLTFTLAYNLLTPIEKPITSLALHSLMDASAQLMQLGASEWGMSPEVSVMAGGMFFYVTTSLFSGLFKDMQFKEKADNPRFIKRWLAKLFLVDLHRDITFYQIGHPSALMMQKCYSFGHLYQSLVKSYLILNYWRGCYQLISLPEYYCFLDTCHLLDLTIPDINYILPIVIFALFYRMLRSSQHPFLILFSRAQARFLCFNVAFVIGLAFCPVPAVYQLGTIGLLSSHLSLRWLFKFLKTLKAELEILFRAK